MSKSQKKPIVKPATRERGEVRYFHGRVKILADFKELLGRAKAGNSGTSILIQAAPGAGKTYPYENPISELNLFVLRYRSSLHDSL